MEVSWEESGGGGVDVLVPLPVLVLVPLLLKHLRGSCCSTTNDLVEERDSRTV